mgnify:CR=1 FL=1
MPRLTEIETISYGNKIKDLLLEKNNGLTQTDAQAISNHLLGWKYKRIEIDEVLPRKVYRSLGDKGRRIVALCLVSAGVLKPLKTSGAVQIAGQLVPRKYDLDLTELDDTDMKKLKRDIDALDVRIRANRPTYLLKHPAEFYANQNGLERLSEWLSSKDSTVSKVTRKERSYEIWGDEKALTEVHGEGEKPLGKLLERSLALDIDSLLSAHDTTSPAYLSYILHGVGFVVVSENKDMFCDLEELLFRNGTVNLFGKTIRGAICGEGWGVISPRFSSFLKQRDITPSELLYIGDIDIDGLAMLEKFLGEIGGEPFTNLYELMLVLHEKRVVESLPLNVYAKEQKRAIDWSALEPYFQSKDLDEMFRLNTQTTRVPQEIVTLPMLEKEAGLDV